MKMRWRRVYGLCLIKQRSNYGQATAVGVVDDGNGYNTASPVIDNRDEQWV